MRVLSLFDGISCARVALNKLGIPIEVYYSSEIDKPAMQIAQKNYPDTIQLGDIKTLFERFDMTPEFGGGIDLLIGGSPCQDLSIAKMNRQGLDGARSGLFWDYVKILKAIKPKHFVLENVASMPKEAKTIITEVLGVEPILINAALVSAQNRKRLFWTNIPNVDLPQDKQIYLKDILQKNEVAFDKYGIEKIKSNTLRLGGSGSGIDDKHNWDMIRVGQVGDNKAQSGRIYSAEGKSVALQANGGGMGAKTGLYVVALTETRTEEAKKIRRENMKNGRDYSPRRAKQLMPRTDGKANTITTFPTKESLVSDLKTYVRKLTPVECERLQCLPDDYTEGITTTQRYKCLGNGFNVDVIKHILSKITI
jgi:DNA-cytosine methyltransferase